MAIPPSAPLGPSPAVPPSDELAAEYDLSDPSLDLGIVIGSNDALDEYTEIENFGLRILEGDRISRNLSTRMPGVIDANLMELDTAFNLVPYASAESLTDIPSWYTNIIRDVGLGFAGCALVASPMNSIYHDPDQDIIVAVNDIPLYGHLNYPIFPPLADPDINDIEAVVLDPGNTDEGFGGDYASADYVNPWDYDDPEQIALGIKYGFDGVTPASAETWDVTSFYLNKGINELADMLATGYTERQDIRKVTEQVNYKRNFENIPEVEPVESLALVQNIVKVIDPMQPVPPSPPRKEMFERKVAAASTTPPLSISPMPTIASLEDIAALDFDSYSFGHDGMYAPDDVGAVHFDPVGTGPTTGADSIVIEGYPGFMGLDLLGGSSSYYPGPTGLDMLGTGDSAGGSIVVPGGGGGGGGGGGVDY